MTGAGARNRDREPRPAGGLFDRNLLNLAVRFLLEMLALVSLAYWGWVLGTGWTRPLLALLLPLAGATVWGVFRVPGDPGNAPVAVTGPVRLGIEAAVFGGSVWIQAHYLSGRIAFFFAAVLVLHYAFDYDRVRRLLTA